MLDFHSKFIGWNMDAELDDPDLNQILVVRHFLFLTFALLWKLTQSYYE